VDQEHLNSWIQEKRKRYREVESLPALAGTERQFPWPCFSTYARSLLSSSGVHGPFLNPTFSQHAILPIFIHTLIIKPETMLLGKKQQYKS